MYRFSSIFTGSIAIMVCLISPASNAAEVNITAEIESVSVQHGKNQVVIRRNQDSSNTINPAFAKTSRQCPPFCIQPASLAPGVETIAELEVLDYLKQLTDGDNSILVVDSRSADWAAKSTIPGAINIPWSRLDSDQGANSISIGEVLQVQLKARNLGGLWDYSNAQTLVMFCNGPWSDEASNSILNLLKYGYPANKIKWYRGGMQSWESLGLTTVAPVE